MEGKINIEDLKAELENKNIRVEEIKLSGDTLFLKMISPEGPDAAILYKSIPRKYGFQFSLGEGAGEGRLFCKYIYDETETVKYTPEAVFVRGRLVHTIGSLSACGRHIKKEDLEDILTNGLRWFPGSYAEGVEFDLGLNYWIANGQAIAILDPHYLYNQYLEDEKIDKFVEKYFIEKEVRRESFRGKLLDEMGIQAKLLEQKDYSLNLEAKAFEVFPYLDTSKLDSSLSINLDALIALYAARHPEKYIVHGKSLAVRNPNGEKLIPKKYFRVYDPYLTVELVYDPEERCIKTKPIEDEAVKNAEIHMKGKEMNRDFFFNFFDIQDGSK